MICRWSTGDGLILPFIARLSVKRTHAVRRWIACRLAGGDGRAAADAGARRATGFRFR